MYNQDQNVQFSSVIIFRATKYMTKNKIIITYNHNSRILRRAFDPGDQNVIND